MAFYQELNHQSNPSSTTYNNNEMPIHLPPLEKQRIEYILDNNNNDQQLNKLPSLLNNNNSPPSNNYQFIPYEPTRNIQRLPSPANSSVSDEDVEEYHHHQATTRQPPTTNEVQYIKRIHALMTLVARQTDEIQSLRQVIASHKCHGEYDNDTTGGNKRNRMQ